MKIPFPDVPPLPGVPAVLRNPALAVTNLPNLVSMSKASIRSTVNDIRNNPVSALQRLGNLLGARDDISAQYNAGLSWGVFNTSNVAVLDADSFLGLDYRNSSRVSSYPLERGSFEAYNKVDDPFDIVVGMAVGGSVARRAAFLMAVEDLKASISTVTVVTPEEVFRSVTLERFDYKRDNGVNAGLLVVNLYFKEVRINTQTQYSGSAPASAAALSPVVSAAAATIPGTSSSTFIPPLPSGEVQNPASASPVSLGQVQALAATALQAAPAILARAQLPVGFVQSVITGVISGPSGKVDPELTIAAGSRLYEGA